MWSSNPTSCKTFLSVLVLLSLFVASEPDTTAVVISSNWRVSNVTEVATSERGAGAEEAIGDTGARNWLDPVPGFEDAGAEGDFWSAGAGNLRVPEAGEGELGSTETRVALGSKLR